MSDLDLLGRQLAVIGRDLTWRKYPLAHVVCRAAAILAERPANPCPGCGGVVVQLPRGRPRTYCSTKCRRRSYSRRNGRVAL